eukprot:1335200-Amorphochlora_amoeboformis.AAC.1
MSLLTSAHSNCRPSPPSLFPLSSLSLSLSTKTKHLAPPDGEELNKAGKPSCSVKVGKAHTVLLGEEEAPDTLDARVRGEAVHLDALLEGI